MRVFFNPFALNFNPNSTPILDQNGLPGFEPASRISAVRMLANALALTALVCGGFAVPGLARAEPALVLSGAQVSVFMTREAVSPQVGAATAMEAAVGRAQLQEITYGEALLMGLAIIMNDNDNDGEPATFTGGSGSNFAGGSG